MLLIPNSTLVLASVTKVDAGEHESSRPNVQQPLCFQTAWMTETKNSAIHKDSFSLIPGALPGSVLLTSGAGLAESSG